MNKGKTLVEVFEEEERSLSPHMRGALAHMLRLELLCKDTPLGGWATPMCPNIEKSNSIGRRFRLFNRPASSTLYALLRRGLIEETTCKMDYETKEYRLTDAGRSVSEGLEQ